MKTLLVLQGLPASGKSTYAVNWVNEDPEHRLRINQDSIRRMFGKYWLEDKIQLKKRESITSNITMELLKQSMINQFDIVLDNMNLNQKTLDEIKEIVEEFNKWISLSPVDLHYDIKYQTFFDTPLEECIARDSKRENPIGENVIRSTYNKYKDVISGNL